MDFIHLNCFMDLHLHLDGSLSLETVRALAKAQDVFVPEDRKALQTQLSVSSDCKDLNMYLTKFDFPLSLLQTEKAIETAVSRLIEELFEQGLMYVEIRFAPALHTRKGMVQEQAVQAAVRGLSGKIPANLILCCMRGGQTQRANLETIRLATRYLGRGVVAVDLAGGEGLWPNQYFTEEFILARKLGVPFTMHAGEARGWESVESALNMGASRIGHGVRAWENPVLLNRLADKQIPLELCPTSNLNTRVFAHIREFPLRTFMDAGVRITINTDNTTVSNTSIRKEWQQLMDTFQLTPQEIMKILEDTIDSTFADAITKTTLRKQLPSI